MTDLSAESLEGNASLLEEFVDESFFDDSTKDDPVELTSIQLPLWDNISPGELYDLLTKENAGKTLPWTKLLNKQWGCIGNALLRVLAVHQEKTGIDKTMKMGKNKTERTRQKILFEKFDEDTAVMMFLSSSKRIYLQIVRLKKDFFEAQPLSLQLLLLVEKDS
jgi:hypothetical protein